MKKLKYLALYSILAFGICYLASAFVHADFNMVNWGASYRGGVIGVWSLLSVVVIMAIYKPSEL